MNKASTPLVSVIIPAYNSASTIVQAVESVLAQTMAPLEIIVVDDGSTDATGELLRPFAARGSIMYLRQDNRGCGAARNKGLGIAKGEYVAFLDSDDLWSADKLERQMRALDMYPKSIVVYTGRMLIGADRRPTGDSYQTSGGVRSQSACIPLVFNNMVTLSSAVAKTEAVRSVGGFTEEYDLMMFADYDLWLRLAPLGMFCSMPEALTLYQTKPAPSVAERKSNHRKIAAVFRNRMKTAPLSIAPWYALGWCMHTVCAL